MTSEASSGSGASLEKLKSQVQELNNQIQSLDFELLAINFGPQSVEHRRQILNEREELWKMKCNITNDFPVPFRSAAPSPEFDEGSPPVPFDGTSLPRKGHEPFPSTDGVLVPVAAKDPEITKGLVTLTQDPAKAIPNDSKSTKAGPAKRGSWLKVKQGLRKRLSRAEIYRQST